MTMPKVSKVDHAKTWRYHLPNTERREGWAIFFLDEIGCFSVVSDFGDYGYRWSEGGWWSEKEYDFREFLLQTDDHYILHKIAPHDTYDPNATLASVKRQIIEARRCQAKSKDWARDEWDLAHRYDELARSEDFARWAEHTSLDEYWECACYGPDPQAVAFMKNVMPRFRARLRAELEAEGVIEPKKSA